MPLPQEVINRLSEDRPVTPGWSSGLLMFACGLLALVVIIYVVIAFVEEPHINNEVNTVQAQVAAISQSPALAQGLALGSFYSQISHVQSLLQQHVAFSQFLAWLESDTQANVYYTSFSFASGDQISMTVLGKTDADVNQQLAIFQADPNVQSMNVSNVSLANVSGFWEANIALTMAPSLLVSTNQ